MRRPWHNAGEPASAAAPSAQPPPSDRRDRVREGLMMVPKLLPKLRTRRELVCQQAVELVTSYLDGALGRSARRRFEAHLAACPHCTEYLAQIRRTIELTGSVTPGDLTEQMQDEFIEIYRRWRTDTES